jgi:hypothetical protein
MPFILFEMEMAEHNVFSLSILQCIVGLIFHGNPFPWMNGSMQIYRAFTVIMNPWH